MKIKEKNRWEREREGYNLIITKFPNERNCRLQLSLLTVELALEYISQVTQLIKIGTF